MPQSWQLSWQYFTFNYIPSRKHKGVLRSPGHSLPDLVGAHTHFPSLNYIICCSEECVYILKNFKLLLLTSSHISQAHPPSPSVGEYRLQCTILLLVWGSYKHRSFGHLGRSLWTAVNLCVIEQCHLKRTSALGGHGHFKKVRRFFIYFFFFKTVFPYSGRCWNSSSS